MTASRLIECKVSSEGVIFITGRYDNKVHLTGYTLPSSPKSYSWSDNFFIQAEKGKTGLLCFSVVEHTGSGKNRTTETFSFLVEVSWTGEKVQLDFDEPFIPKPGRLAQMGVFSLAVTIDGVIFTTEHHYGSVEKMNDPTKHYEVDGDWICKFVNGDIGVDEFRDQITSWREQESLKAELSRLTLALEVRVRQFDFIDDENVRLRRELDYEKQRGTAYAFLGDLITDLQLKIWEIEQSPSRLFPETNRNLRYGKLLRAFFASDNFNKYLEMLSQKSLPSITNTQADDYVFANGVDPQFEPNVDPADDPDAIRTAAEVLSDEQEADIRDQHRDDDASVDAHDHRQD